MGRSLSAGRKQIGDESVVTRALTFTVARLRSLVALRVPSVFRLRAGVLERAIGMSVREWNPNNPTTRRMQDNQDMYAKLLACVLWKYRDVLPADVVITEADIVELSGGLCALVVDDSKGRIRLSVVDHDEGARIAKRAGGLPS
jgi:hypothetical protein